MSVSPAKGAPERATLEGRYVRLEPLELRHAADLLAVSQGEGVPERYRWLPSEAPTTIRSVQDWIENANAGGDRYVAVIDRQTERAVGRQAWLRIFPQHASIEIGGIYWGLPMARTRLATEALYLFARHAFDDLGYRRFEWKCNTLNEPSKAAARRFGFQYEGLFRQDMIVKGESRDTAWFSIIDGEWPACRPNMNAGFRRTISTRRGSSERGSPRGVSPAPFSSVGISPPPIHALRHRPGISRFLYIRLDRSSSQCHKP